MTKSIETLDQFIKAANAALWTEELWHSFLSYFRSQNIDRVIYHHLPPLGAPDEGKTRIAAEGFPIDWLAPYVREKLYRIDPIPLYALRTEQPFYWSDIRKRGVMEPEQQAFLDRLEAQNLGDGLAIQVFGPGGRNGYFGLGIKDKKPSRNQVSEFQCVCNIGHQKYCQDIRSRLPKPPALSGRELQILEWVARGKSNSVIADIMGISSHTVDAYMRRVFLKLGATDRITAAIRGIGSGLITGYIA